MDPAVSIHIVTRNRKEHVLVALGSCFAQTYPALEVRVYDAASTDGTEEAVRHRFPAAVFCREDTDRGLPALRNRAAREAQADILITLDDDAYFTDISTVEQVVRELEAHPGAAALALPFVSPNMPGDVRRDCPNREQPVRLRSFTGCAHVTRRDAVLRMGPYREIPGYYREDRDLGIRLLGEGLQVIEGHTPPVVHLHSPSRNWNRRFKIDVVSTLLFDFLNIPNPYVVPRMLADAAGLLLYRFSFRDLLPRIGYVLRGLAACFRHRRDRRPVSREAYRLYRTLPSHEAAPCGTACPPPAGASS